jgi:hypothetical protein
MEKVFKTIDVKGKQHVIIEVNRIDYKLLHGQTTQRNVAEQPNYRGSGMALCGILKKGQTLEQFKANYKPVGNNPTPKKKRA